MGVARLPRAYAGVLFVIVSDLRVVLDPGHRLVDLVEQEDDVALVVGALGSAPPDGLGGARPTFVIEGVDVLVMELLAA